MTQRIVVLNGFDAEDPMEARTIAALQRIAAERGDALHEVVARRLRLGHCTGCFCCFVRSPGECVIGDEARSVLAQIASSDVVVPIGRISFGGYSAALKRILDRLLPLLLPFFDGVHGEMHHPPRYGKLPRIVAIGLLRVQAQDPRQAEVFRALVGRNAINLYSPSHACEVVSGEASEDALLRQIRAAFEQSDPVVGKKDLRAFVPRPSASASAPWEEGREGRPRRMLSLVGSPKIGPSTSAVIGAYLEERMRAHGWETESITLKGSLRGQAERDALVSAARRANLVSLAFPLYVDSLPYLPTLALEVLASEPSGGPSSPSGPKRFLAFANSGFPEPHQNKVALAICERFAATVGWAWSGGLALGAGEAMCSGVPLKGPSRVARPPATRLLRALDMSADALARGHTIPDNAQDLLDRSPIPGLPFSWWLALYRLAGVREWRRRARKQHVALRTLRAQPLAPVG